MSALIVVRLAPNDWNAVYYLLFFVVAFVFAVVVDQTSFCWSCLLFVVAVKRNHGVPFWVTGENKSWMKNRCLSFYRERTILKSLWSPQLRRPQQMDQDTQGKEPYLQVQMTGSSGVVDCSQKHWSNFVYPLFQSVLVLPERVLTFTVFGNIEVWHVSFLLTLQPATCRQPNTQTRTRFMISKWEIDCDGSSQKQVQWTLLIKWKTRDASWTSHNLDLKLTNF